MNDNFFVLFIRISFPLSKHVSNDKQYQNNTWNDNELHVGSERNKIQKLGKT